MTRFYVPYAGRKPASLSINGHRLVLVALDADSAEDSMELSGADRVKKLEVGTSQAEQSEQLDAVARKAKSGVVLVPPEAEIDEVIRNLETQLPWLQ
jgi:hypothetical protein